MSILLLQIETKARPGLTVVIERGKSPAWRMSVDNLPLWPWDTPKVGDYPRSTSDGRKSTLESAT